MKEQNCSDLKTISKKLFAHHLLTYWSSSTRVKKLPYLGYSFKVTWLSWLLRHWGKQQRVPLTSSDGPCHFPKPKNTQMFNLILI